MNNRIVNLSITKAAVTVGVAFITSVILVTIVDDFLLANFVVPGDSEALVRDIEANEEEFNWAVVGYILVLLIDIIIGLALYLVLKPANKKRALLTALLRVLYAIILIIGVLALVSEVVDVYGYGSIKLIGYLFFALHILVLGYSVFVSEYIPKSLGVLLIIASLTYITFFVDFNLPEAIQMSVMVIMAVAELALSIWFIVKRNSLPKST
jgi:hypothetical protein